jgi:hypothetical protein
MHIAICHAASAPAGLVFSMFYVLANIRVLCPGVVLLSLENSQFDWSVQIHDNGCSNQPKRFNPGRFWRLNINNQ